MTAQFTNTGIILPSNLTADVVSSKPDTNYAAADEKAFSSALDNAAKSYADKNTNKVENVKDNNDYAKDTKDLNKTGNHSEIRDDKNTNKTDNKTNDKNNVKESSDDNKNIKDEKGNTKDTQVSDKETAETYDNNEPETEKSKITSEVKELGEAALKQVENLLQDIQNNAVSVETKPETKTDIKTTVVDTEVPAVQNTAENNALNNAKTIANEQILANLEYSQETPELNLEKIKNMTPQELKALVENIQKSAQSTDTQIQNPEVKLETNAEVKQAAKPETQTVSIENLTRDTSDEPKIDIQTNSQSDKKLTENTKDNQQAVLKTAKENLAADTARLTANVEQAEETLNVKPVTPKDTEADKTPVIKVTEEVASQVKENAFNGIENKDNTSKIKDKAVQTMTALQDTDTTVTESKMSDTNSDSKGGNLNNSNNSNNSAMNQGSANAAETAAKLSVDQGSVSLNQSNGAEAFVSKLDAQLSAMQNSSNQAKTLNQTDIMSQVTAKFEQLQQQSSNKVSIVLQPENLGRVSVEIMNSKDGLVAKMTTDTQQVKELFDKNVEALKSNLSSQGVNVNSIKVECSQESSNHGMEFEREQFNQSFENHQNGQNQTNHSNSNTQSAYAAEYETSQNEDVEAENTTEIKNTQTTIKHNGKVDYKV